MSEGDLGFRSKVVLMVLCTQVLVSRLNNTYQAEGNEET